MIDGGGAPGGPRFEVAARLALGVACALAPAIGFGAPTGLRQPALSPDGASLAFVWEGDLWRVESIGGEASPLVRSPWDDRRPVWSPDGCWIVFASRRDGDYDLFVVPAAGGRERRLTWAEGDDWPSGFTPDGAAVIFHSRRGSETTRVFRLPLAGGEPEPLTSDESSDGVVSPDGRTLAFSAGGLPWWRTNARGPAARRLLTLRLGERHADPLSAGGDQQLWPQWLPDGRLLVVSSASLVANLWFVDPRDGSRARLTDHTDEGVRFPSLAADGSRVAYEHRGEILVRKLRGRDRESRALSITLPDSRRPAPVDTARLEDGVDRLALSPDRRSLAVEARGEILLADLQAWDRGETARATNLTGSPWREAAPAFSPDGSRLVFEGDANGRRGLWSLSLDPDSAGRSPSPILYREAAGEATRPAFSSDGRYLAYVLESQGDRLVLADAGGGRERTLLSAARIGGFSFRPDGLWLACAREDRRGRSDLVLCSIFGEEEVPLTGDDAEEVDPVWSPDGRRLVYRTRSEGVGSLWVVSFDGSGGSLGLAAGPAPLASFPGEITAHAFGGPRPGDLLVGSFDGDRGSLWLGDCEGDAWRRVLRLNSNPVELLPLTPNTEVICRLGSGEVLRIDWNLRLQAPAALEGTVAVDRRGEIEQIFGEAWRILGDRFYDPALHLRDWAGIRDRYQPRLGGCATREEARELVLMMIGELDASHANLERPSVQDALEDGDLGLDLRVDGDGALRVERVLEGGPSAAATSPAGAARRPRAGDRLLSLDGVRVAPGCPIESLLAGTAGREVAVELERRSTGRWTVPLRAISAEERERAEARALDAARADRVARLGGGRIAYLRLRAIDGRAAARIEETLRPAAGPPPSGLVLDLRGNPGGHAMDAVLAALARRPLATLRGRAHDDRLYPARSWAGRMVAIIDPSTASAAELVALGIARHRLGTLVGLPTYGGVLGSRERRMIDGSRFQSPEAGWYRLDGVRLENRGVEPDVRVENRFGDTVEEDAQLLAAIRLARGETR